jgi:hypothetical protein
VVRKIAGQLFIAAAGYAREEDARRHISTGGPT